VRQHFARLGRFVPCAGLAAQLIPPRSQDVARYKYAAGETALGKSSEKRARPVLRPAFVSSSRSTRRRLWALFHGDAFDPDPVHDASASFGPASWSWQGVFLVILTRAAITICARSVHGRLGRHHSQGRSIVLQSLEVSHRQQPDRRVPFSITVTARDPRVLVSGFTGAVRVRELTSFGEGRITPSTGP